MDAWDSRWLFPAFLLLGLAYAVYIQRKRSRLLESRYWSRPCTGSEWKKCFPEASKHEIRAFLDVFVNAFGFTKKQRLSFSPQDKLMDVYRTLYFDHGMADCLELEELVTNLEAGYQLSIQDEFLANATLGELFGLTRQQS